MNLGYLRRIFSALCLLLALKCLSYAGDGRDNSGLGLSDTLFSSGQRALEAYNGINSMKDSIVLSVPSYTHQQQAVYSQQLPLPISQPAAFDSLAINSYAQKLDNLKFSLERKSFFSNQALGSGAADQSFNQDPWKDFGQETGRLVNQDNLLSKAEDR